MASSDDDVYTELARRLLREVIEMQVDSIDTVPKKQHDREIKKLQQAVEAFKTSAQDLAQQVDKALNENDKLERTIEELRGQLNEAIVNGQLGRELNRAGYTLDQHMSKEAYAKWREIVELMKAPGSRRGD